MAQYQVIATKQKPRGKDPKYARIVGLYTTTRSDKPRGWTFDQVKKAIQDGHVFLIYKAPAAVRIGHHKKHGDYLTTYGDQTRANNLNELPVWDSPP